MKKFIIWIIILVIAAGLGLILARFYANNTQPPPSQQIENKAGSTQIKPWVEVVRPSVYLLNPDDTVAFELQTGDEIDPGTKLRTNENGLANIYFPNGSVARMDVNSQITISGASYNESNQTMIVRIMLGFGRVWSKIFKLATPESSWEVDTTNAVATVRGTAFGVEFENGNTNIVGSENEVEVSFIDPVTEKKIENNQTIVTPDRVLAIDDRITAMARSGERIGLPGGAVAAPSPVLTSEWVRRFKEADALLEGKILPANTSIKYINPETLKQVIQGEVVSQPGDAAVTNTVTTTSASTTQSPTGATAQPSTQPSTTQTIAPSSLNTINLTQPTGITLLGQTVNTTPTPVTNLR